MSEVYKSYEGTAMFLGFVMGATVISGAVQIGQGIAEGNNPTPQLELSGTPDQVVFQVASNTQIQKGIKAAMEVCRFKNAAVDHQADGKSTVKVGCESGTLKTTSVIVPRVAQQGR